MWVEERLNSLGSVIQPANINRRIEMDLPVEIMNHRVTYTS